MNINKVIVIGKVTKDIELKESQSGFKFANISLATNRSYKDKEGQKVDEVEFVDFVAYGIQAGVLAQYCVKGQTMYFEGRLKTRSWEKDGVTHRKTEVIIENFQFGQKPSDQKSYNKKQGDFESPKDWGMDIPTVVDVEESNEELPF